MSFQPTVSRAGCPLAVPGSLCLLAEGFQGQAARHPKEFPGHRFELFHQGPALFKPAASGLIFEL